MSMAKIENIARAGALAVLVFAVMAAGPACAPKRTAPPVWAAEGPPDMDGEWFYGVGCAQPEIDNRWFKRMTARERARVDLAEHVNDYLVEELDGDTASARAVLETVLPEREDADQYTDEQGHLCALARLSRARVDLELNKSRRARPPAP